MAVALRSAWRSAYRLAWTPLACSAQEGRFLICVPILLDSRAEAFRRHGCENEARRAYVEGRPAGSPLVKSRAVRQWATRRNVRLQTPS